MAGNLMDLRFEVEFFKGEETQTVAFGITFNPDHHDNAKEAAIAHIGQVWEDLKTDGLAGWMPRFKTFYVVDCRRLDDQGMP